jgi:threonyl-tRNA synthetase
LRRGPERRAGYQHVYSPVLAKRELYEISGHWEAVVGARESAEGTVSLRLRTGLALDPMPAQVAVDHIAAAADPLRQLTRRSG